MASQIARAVSTVYPQHKPDGLIWFPEGRAESASNICDPSNLLVRFEAAWREWPHMTIILHATERRDLHRIVSLRDRDRW